MCTQEDLALTGLGEKRERFEVEGRRPVGRLENMVKVYSGRLWVDGIG